MYARIDAVNVVAEDFKPLLDSFVKPAVVSIAKASSDEVFNHEEFTDGKKVVKYVETLIQAHSPNLKEICELMHTLFFLFSS
jgi:hypothetical protein